MRRLSLSITAPGKVSIEESPISPPGAGKVLVKTTVSAISPGTEMLIYRGQAPSDIPMDETIPSLTGEFSFPIKYGYAAVGEAVQVGEGVDKGWEGKAVFSFHAHESYFLCSPEELVVLPSGMSLENAAILPNMETAVNFLMDGRPSIGEQAVVLGQGVVGLLTTALLAKVPLSSLVTADRYPNRRARSLQLGATASLDPGEPGVLSRMKTALGDGSDYMGADIVYELSGSPEALDTALGVAGYNGRIVVGSWYGNKESLLHLGGRFHRSRVRIISSQVSTIAPEWSGRWAKSRRLSVAWNMLRQVQPSSLITHRFPIEEAAEAYRIIEEHPDEAIQVLLTYPD